MFCCVNMFLIVNVVVLLIDSFLSNVFCYSYLLSYCVYLVISVILVSTCFSTRWYLVFAFVACSTYNPWCLLVALLASFMWHHIVVTLCSLVNRFTSLLQYSSFLYIGYLSISELDVCLEHNF